MKKAWVAVIAIIAITFVIGLVAVNKIPKKENAKDGIPFVKMAGQSYWTCPMHQQIHADHAGECPICHMKLMQVKAQPAQNAEREQKELRAPVQANAEQFALLGVERTEVEKMDLRLKIPVSGRFISTSSIAFQIYESDLRYVKPGLSFHGASSFYPEVEVSGVISSVDSIVDPTSRTVRVVGAVRKGPRDSLSETGFRGDIQLVLKDHVAIPESAVVHTGENDLVYVFANGNQLKPTIVKLGLKTEGFYDVLGGVEPGQFISSGPNFLIDSESKIRSAAMLPDGEKDDSHAPSTPSCPKDQHWNTPMAMCMPGHG